MDKITLVKRRVHWTAAVMIDRPSILETSDGLNHEVGIIEIESEAPRCQTPDHQDNKSEYQIVGGEY